MKLICKSNLGKTAVVAIVLFGAACSKDQGQVEEPVQAEETSQDAVENETNEEVMMDVEIAIDTDTVIETMATPDINRVVMYAVSEAKIYADASEANEVGKLLQGETIVVLAEGDWFKISNNMYVKKADLSNVAVSRVRPAKVWIKPAH